MNEHIGRRAKLTFAGLSAAIIVGVVAAFVGSAELVAVAILVATGAVGMLSLAILVLVQSRSTSIRDNLQRQTREQTTLLRAGHNEILRSIAQANGVEPSAMAGATQSKDSEEGHIGNTLGATGKYFGIGPDFEYAERARENLGALETFALRTKSVRMRDALARNATNMQFSFDDAMRVLSTFRAGLSVGNAPKLIKSWSPSGLAAVARVLVNQQAEPDDVYRAEMIFAQIRRLWGDDALNKADRYLYVECLQGLGRYGAAQRASRELRLTVRDRAHASLSAANGQLPSVRGDGTWADWLGTVNKMYSREGIEAISLASGTGSPLDRLVSVGSARRTIEGPLVSVIMPTYNGSAYVETAIRSLAQQTWKQIEIIVVDDCSDDSEQSRLAEVVAKYPDVRVIWQESNLGSYVARNRALQEARGEFITVHDDDDWSHPAKLEVQMLHLLDNPEAMANMSRHARCSDQLYFVRINNNPSFVQANFSSMLIRRRAFSEIGHWDLVNRGGDAEFRDRLVTHYGAPVPVVGAAPLSFTRTRLNSLTAGEMSRGYVDPSRLFYMASYQRQHSMAKGDAMKASSEIARPLNMLPGNRHAHLGHFDIVYATDFKFPGGTSSLAIQEIRAAVRLGYRVGVIQLDSPLNSGTRAVISEKFLELLAAEDVAVLSLLDRADIDFLLVRHPTTVQYLDSLQSSLSVRRAYLVVNTPPVLRGGRGAGYDLKECVEILEAAVGVRAELVPESGVTRVACAAHLPEAMLASFDWPGFLDTRETSFRGRSVNPKRRPVVGRHSRDNVLKWPDTLDEFVAAYHRPRSFSTKVLGGLDSIRATLPSGVLEDIEVLPFGSVEPSDYLQDIDFWVYAHSSKWTESFGMAPAEAMAAGLVCILPPYMKATFGDGAVYAAPNDVEALVRRYWADSELYTHQSNLARARIESDFSLRAYGDRLRMALG